jgi:carbon catabolite-derepressing protein kinase
MNLQLYMVDSINYLVDFHHKKSYKASTEPGAGKFDMAIFDPLFSTEKDGSESGRSLKEKDTAVKEDDVVSPFVFMDVACRLILELAGGSE